MSIELLSQMQKHYLHRDIAARKWKKDGGRVVGYLCNLVPEEMILAAGFFPFRIPGDPSSGTALADKYTEPSYEPDVRSILNLILAGKYDFLDYIIIPHSRDSISKLYQHLCKISRIESRLRIPELYFFDLTHTRFWLICVLE